MGANRVTKYSTYCAQGGGVDRSTQWLTVGWSATPTESAGSRPLTTTRRWESTNFAAQGTQNNKRKAEE